MTSASGAAAAGKVSAAPRQAGRDGQAEAHGLARSGLGRHQQVLAGQIGGGHRLLHGGERGVAPGLECICERLFHVWSTFAGLSVAAGRRVVPAPTDRQPPISACPAIV